MDAVRPLTAILTAVVLSTFAEANEPPERVREITPGVLRIDGSPAAYVLCGEHRGIVVGPPERVRAEDLRAYGVQACKLALVTHHHRDSSAGADEFIARGGEVRAGKRSADWLTPDGVRRFWEASLPPVLPGQFPPLFHRQWAIWAYWVRPVGIEGIRCDLEDDQELRVDGWKIRVVATPGHSPDHVAYLAEPTPADGRRIALCGDAFCEPGKMWTPYTAECHHQKADGLVATAESLRRLAALSPTVLCPEHGPVIVKGVQPALEATVLNLQRAVMLKSFEQFRSQHAPDTPLPEFVAPDQVGSATPEGNTRPWSRLSAHLFLSGNTYALTSRDGPVLLVDPYDRELRRRLAELRQDYGLGPPEVALITHGHNDHYTGLFALPDGTHLEVWTLDRTADAISSPNRLRAPYVDPRPVRVHRRLTDAQKAQWREYSLRFEHQPGQTDFAMSIEVEVDGRRVIFTGDNFYRADQYTGSGGWSGLNRGLPGGYVGSIQRLMEREPAWVLAEHGGAIVYERRDFELRRQWAAAASNAADALSPSGDQRLDWDPHRVHFEPVRMVVRPGQALEFELVAKNPTDAAQRISLTCDPLARPFVTMDEPIVCELPARQEIRRKVTMKLAENLAAGRRIMPFRCTWDERQEAADVFLVVEVATQ